MNEDPEQFQRELVKVILHRCVDLEWNANRLCVEAGVSTANWSKIRRFKISPGIDTAIRLCRAVGLEVSYRLAPNPAPEEG